MERMTAMILKNLNHKEKKEFQLATALGVKWNKKLFIVKTILVFTLIFIIPLTLSFAWDLNFKGIIALTTFVLSALLINNFRVKAQRKIIPLGYEKLCPAQQTLGNLLKGINANKNNDTKISGEKFELLAFDDWYCWVEQLSLNKERNYLVFRIAFSDCSFPVVIPHKFKENLTTLKKDELYKINMKMNPKHEVINFDFSLFKQ